MPDSTSRLRAPVLPKSRPAQAPGTALVPIAGGRTATRPKPVVAAANRQHSHLELGVLALCAAAVTLVAALLVFTIVRDKAYLDRSAPLVTPLKP
jgi:putative intracellular protease/amidase